MALCREGIRWGRVGENPVAGCRQAAGGGSVQEAAGQEGGEDPALVDDAVGALQLFGDSRGFGAFNIRLCG